jgi:uncharacterized 2Fe-2S/4Fe-4S cluster protein (DUF4445 family)
VIKLKIISSGKAVTAEIDSGLSLLDILRSRGFDIYAPCGGKGTCGKCRVSVRGEGEVISCKYFPDRDIEIILPGEQEAKILVHQTDFLDDVPFRQRLPDNSSSKIYGVAIDIGTTTVIFYFLNLVTGQVERISSVLNPQAKYGADIISRINYCQENETGLAELRGSIVDAINRELKTFIRKKNVVQDLIEEVVVAGNTTMLHLLLGRDPVSIALAPFRPAFTEKQVCRGSATGLNINPDGKVITLPCQTAYVGADIFAGLAVLKPVSRNYLFLDIGTNGEMAIMKNGRMFTCATAAGPAFEGANISCGMAAVTGALSHFNGPDDYTVVGNSEPTGICGSGIIDIVAWLLKNRLIDETGLLKEPYSIGPDSKISVNQQDIREIQLAKSAICSGIRILMKVTESAFDEIDALYLAGGFGNYINIDSAIGIGLLPAEMRGKIFPVGNSAGIGALQYLKSDEIDKRISGLLENSEYIELSNYDEFMTEFAMNMDFPGK